MTGFMQTIMGSGAITGSLALSNAAKDGVAYTDGVSAFSVGTATVRLRTNGQLEYEYSDGFGLGTTTTDTVTSQWGTPLGLPGYAYEAQLTVSSGVSPTGSATATYLTLDATRAWTLNGLGSTNAGSQSGVYTLTVRNKLNPAQSVTATITLSAQNRSTP